MAKRKYSSIGTSGGRRFKRVRRAMRSYKRSYKRSGRNFGSWRPLPMSSRPIKFKYFAEVGLNAAAGALVDYVFSANGMYDPDITSTGHQPYAFDTMMSMYNHYTVIGSKIKVTAVNNQAGQPFHLAVALRDNATSLSGTGKTVILEQPGITKYLLGSTTTGNYPVTNNRVVKGFSAKKFFRKKDIIASADYKGSTSANPTEGAFYHVMVIPQSTDDLGNQIVNVEIEFIAVLTEPVILSQS